MKKLIKVIVIMYAGGKAEWNKAFTFDIPAIDEALTFMHIIVYHKSFLSPFSLQIGGRMVAVDILAEGMFGHKL